MGEKINGKEIPDVGKEKNAESVLRLEFKA
jgi:hypothetical protein